MSRKTVLGLSALLVLACLVTLKLTRTSVAHASPKHSPQEQSTGGLAPALPTAPATWVVFSAPSPGTAATATRAAGGSGVKHVATCVYGSLTNFSTTGGAVSILELLDGTTIVAWWDLPTVSNSPAPGLSQFNVCGLNIVGSANSAMTLRLTGPNSNVYQNVNLVGYDAM